MFPKNNYWPWERFVFCINTKKKSLKCFRWPTLYIKRRVALSTKKVTTDIHVPSSLTIVSTVLPSTRWKDFGDTWQHVSLLITTHKSVDQNMPHIQSKHNYSSFVFPSKIRNEFIYDDFHLKLQFIL